MARNAEDEGRLRESGREERAEGSCPGLAQSENLHGGRVVLDKDTNLAVVPKNVSFEGCCTEDGDGCIQPLMSIRRTTVGSDSGRGSESSFRALQSCSSVDVPRSEIPCGMRKRKFPPRELQPKSCKSKLDERCDDDDDGTDEDGAASLQIIAGTGRFSRNSSVSSSSQGQSSAQEPSPSLSSSSTSDYRGINLPGGLPAPHMTPASTTSSFGISPKSRQDEEEMSGSIQSDPRGSRKRRSKGISLILGDDETQQELEEDEEDLGFSLDLQDSEAFKAYQPRENYEKGEKWEGLLDLAPSTSSVPSERTILGSDRSSMQSLGIEFSTRKSSVDPDDLSPSKESPIKAELKSKDSFGTSFILGADDLDDEYDYVTDEEDADDEEEEESENYFIMLDQINQHGSRNTNSPKSVCSRSQSGGKVGSDQQEPETGVEALEELKMDFPMRVPGKPKNVLDITPQDAAIYQMNEKPMERIDSITNAADLAQAGFQRVDTGQLDIMCHQPKIRKVKKVGPYLLGDTLGEGSFGKVKEGMDCDTLCRIAVKIFKVRLLRKKIPTVEKQIYSEIGHMQKLRHRNIIQLLDVITRPEKEKLYLFMEYCVGSLEAMLRDADAKRFPEWQAHNYFTQLITGLEYLHSLGVVHCDIKPGNLLLAVDETLKITDFGEAVVIDRFSGSNFCSVNQGTPTFQSPEVASGNVRVRGFPVDIWAAGVSLYNMCSGQYPYEGDTVLLLYEEISSAPLVMPNVSGRKLSVDLQTLLFGILNKDPKERFTIHQIWKSNWMRYQPEMIGAKIPLPRRVPVATPGSVQFNSDSPAYLLFPYFERLYEKTAYDAEIELDDERRLRKVSVWSCANLSLPKFPVSSSPVELGPLSIQVPEYDSRSMGPHSGKMSCASYQSDEGSEDGLQFTVNIGGKKASPLAAESTDGYHRVGSTPQMTPASRGKLKKSMGESLDEEPRKIGRIFGNSLSSSFASLVRRRENRETTATGEFSGESSRNSSVSGPGLLASSSSSSGNRHSWAGKFKLPRLPQRVSQKGRGRQHGSIEENISHEAGEEPASDQLYSSSRSNPGRRGSQEKCVIQ